MLTPLIDMVATKATLNRQSTPFKSRVYQGRGKPPILLKGETTITMIGINTQLKQSEMKHF